MEKIVAIVLFLWAHNAEEQRWLRFRVELSPPTMMNCVMSQVDFNRWETQVKPGWKVLSWSCEPERRERYTAWYRGQ